MRNGALWFLAAACTSGIALSAPAAKPRFGTLPAGTVAPPPEGAAPSDIKASERARYFSMARPGGSVFESHGASMRFLFPDEATAQAYAAAPSGSSSSEACYVLRRGHQADSDDWPSSFEPRPHVMSDEPGKALAAHYERFVDGKRPRLEIADAWVDPSSGGARAIASSTLPLAAVASGPRGVRVHAAREGRSVHFVVLAPKHEVRASTRSLGDKVLGALFLGDGSDHGRSFIQSILGGMTVSSSGGELGRSDCGHVRVELDAEHGGSSATVQVEVALPRADSDADEPPVREIRARSLQVHLSVSQLSADREPVLSASFGWLGKPRSIPF